MMNTKNGKLYIVSALAVKQHVILSRITFVQHCVFEISGDTEIDAELKAYNKLKNDFPEIDGWYSYSVLLTQFSDLEHTYGSIK